MCTISAETRPQLMSMAHPINADNCKATSSYFYFQWSICQKSFMKMYRSSNTFVWLTPAFAYIHTCIYRQCYQPDKVRKLIKTKVSFNNISIVFLLWLHLKMLQINKCRPRFTTFCFPRVFILPREKHLHNYNFKYCYVNINMCKYKITFRVIPVSKLVQPLSCKYYVI